MIEAVIALAIYLCAGWCITNFVDTESILPNAFVILFWPLVGVWELFTFIFLI